MMQFKMPQPQKHRHRRHHHHHHHHQQMPAVDDEQKHVQQRLMKVQLRVQQSLNYNQYTKPAVTLSPTPSFNSSIGDMSANSNSKTTTPATTSPASNTTDDVPPPTQPPEQLQQLPPTIRKVQSFVSPSSLPSGARKKRSMPNLLARMTPRVSKSTFSHILLSSKSKQQLQQQNATTAAAASSGGDHEVQQPNVVQVEQRRHRQRRQQHQQQQPQPPPQDDEDDEEVEEPPPTTEKQPLELTISRGGQRTTSSIRKSGLGIQGVRQRTMSFLKIHENWSIKRSKLSNKDLNHGGGGGDGTASANPALSNVNVGGYDKYGLMMDMSKDDFDINDFANGDSSDRSLTQPTSSSNMLMLDASFKSISSSTTSRRRREEEFPVPVERLLLEQYHQQQQMQEQQHADNDDGRSLSCNDLRSVTGHNHKTNGRLLSPPSRKNSMQSMNNNKNNSNNPMIPMNPMYTPTMSPTTPMTPSNSSQKLKTKTGQSVFSMQELQMILNDSSIRSHTREDGTMHVEIAVPPIEVTGTGTGAATTSSSSPSMPTDRQRISKGSIDDVDLMTSPVEDGGAGGNDGTIRSRRRQQRKQQQQQQQLQQKRMSASSASADEEDSSVVSALTSPPSEQEPTKNTTAPTVTTTRRSRSRENLPNATNGSIRNSNSNGSISKMKNTDWEFNRRRRRSRSNSLTKRRNSSRQRSSKSPHRKRFSNTGTTTDTTTDSSPKDKSNKSVLERLSAMTSSTFTPHVITESTSTVNIATRDDVVDGRQQQMLMSQQQSESCGSLLSPSRARKRAIEAKFSKHTSDSDSSGNKLGTMNAVWGKLKRSSSAVKVESRGEHGKHSNNNNKKYDDRNNVSPYALTRKGSKRSHSAQSLRDEEHDDEPNKPSSRGRENSAWDKSRPPMHANGGEHRFGRRSRSKGAPRSSNNASSRRGHSPSRAKKGAPRRKKDCVNAVREEVIARGGAPLGVQRKLSKASSARHRDRHGEIEQKQAKPSLGDSLKRAIYEDIVASAKGQQRNQHDVSSLSSDDSDDVTKIIEQQIEESPTVLRLLKMVETLAAREERIDKVLDSVNDRLGLVETLAAREDRIDKVLGNATDRLDMYEDQLTVVQQQNSKSELHGDQRLVVQQQNSISELYEEQLSVVEQDQSSQHESYHQLSVGDLRPSMEPNPYQIQPKQGGAEQKQEEDESLSTKIANFKSPTTTSTTQEDDSDLESDVSSYISFFG